MKRFKYLPLISLFLVSCESKTHTNKTEDKEHTVVINHEEIKDSTITLEFEYIDTTANPKEDFYQYACGEWLKNNPIPEEESRWSSFNVLADRNNNILNNILEKASSGDYETGSANQLIGDYYASFMDTIKRNAQGVELLKPEIENIEKIVSKEDLIKTVAHLHDRGVSAFWGTYVSQDSKRNSKYRLHVHQGGLGLPNKDYYFKDDERSEKVRSGYKTYIKNLFNEVGVESTTKKPADLIPYYIEEKLAEFSKGPVELRKVEENYNKTASGLFNASYPNILWDTYLSERGIQNIDTIIIGQPRYIVGLNKLIETESIEDLKIYLKWKLVNSFSDALNTNMANENFHFYNTIMRGTKVQKPMWKQGIASVTGSAVGEALGQAFVEDNFSEDAKVKINQMVENITLVFDERINNLDWMGKDTKGKAKEKLSAFAKKLGFPDNWKDYSSLTINKESYFQNVVNSNRFKVAENLSKLEKEIDKTEWGMVPHIVNAYYNPLLYGLQFQVLLCLSCIEE